ncbi:DUF2935 domain-containing protein [Neobacillus sp. LXY-4]|uniref:DUF2935 domain-containing protein n=1 Tax=Neobacillus sp. LXY-4 TaxID=3379826 RepID=UPI003EE3C431
MRNYQQSARFEHGFWLQILGDHGRFIHDSLAPTEIESIETANDFIRTFDQLLSEVEAGDLVQLSIRALAEAKRIRLFKLEILSKLLQGTIKIHLPPTFVNHMVNEVEEYIRVLDYLQREEVPPIFHELHHHNVWLLDGAGHAAAIASKLDPVEKHLKEKSERYTKHFEDFYLKAVELTGYLRTNLTEFPALRKFNSDVSLHMTLFMNFLNELEELELTNQALGTFSALMADHMAREECYYLTKVAQSAQNPMPNCDPTKPRQTK